MRGREEVVAYLQRIVDKLQTGEPITLWSVTDTASIDISDQVEFEVQAEEKVDREMSLEIDVEWG